VVARPYYITHVKSEKKLVQLEDVELVPDAMARLVGAIKHAARPKLGKPAVATIAFMDDG
jgi:hypothetical protein